MTSVAASFFASVGTPVLPGGGAGVGQPTSAGFGVLLTAGLSGGIAPAAALAGDATLPTTAIATLLASTAELHPPASPVSAAPTPAAASAPAEPALAPPQTALASPQTAFAPPANPAPAVSSHTASGPRATPPPADAAPPTQPIPIVEPVADPIATSPAVVAAPTEPPSPISAADHPAPANITRHDRAAPDAPAPLRTPAPATAPPALTATRSPTADTTAPAQPATVATVARDNASENVPASIDLPVQQPDPALVDLTLVSPAVVSPALVDPAVVNPALVVGMVGMMAPPPAIATAEAAPVAASTNKPDTIQASRSPDPRGQSVGDPLTPAPDRHPDQRVAPIDDGRGETRSGRGDDAATSGHSATPIDRASATAAPRDGTPAFSLPTAPPATATPVRPAAADAITAQPGRIGQELGVAIARHVATGGATGGGETITLRLNPVDMGRIDVQLSFDDGGTLRAIVSADNPAALEMLRRDSADLGRALTDAGVRSDTQTLRFDTRQGGGNSQSGGQPWQRQPEPRGGMTADTRTDTTDDITAIYRPLRTRGRVDMVA